MANHTPHERCVHLPEDLGSCSVKQMLRCTDTPVSKDIIRDTSSMANRYRPKACRAKYLLLPAKIEQFRILTLASQIIFRSSPCQIVVISGIWSAIDCLIGD